jgi:hypothetical protein
MSRLQPRADVRCRLLAVRRQVKRDLVLIPCSHDDDEGSVLADTGANPAVALGAARPRSWVTHTDHGAGPPLHGGGRGTPALRRCQLRPRLQRDGAGGMRSTATSRAGCWRGWGRRRSGCGTRRARGRRGWGCCSRRGRIIAWWEGGEGGGWERGAGLVRATRPSGSAVSLNFGGGDAAGRLSTRSACRAEDTGLSLDRECARPKP